MREGYPNPKQSEARTRRGPGRGHGGVRAGSRGAGWEPPHTAPQIHSALAKKIDIISERKNVLFHCNFYKSTYNNFRKYDFRSTVIELNIRGKRSGFDLSGMMEREWMKHDFIQTKLFLHGLFQPISL